MLPMASRDDSRVDDVEARRLSELRRGPTERNHRPDDANRLTCAKDPMASPPPVTLPFAIQCVSISAQLKSLSDTCGNETRRLTDADRS